MWQPTTAWSLNLIPSPGRLDSVQNCLLSSLGQNYHFFHCQPQTLGLRLDVKHKRKAEVALGDLFTSCQG